MDVNDLREAYSEGQNVLQLLRSQSSAGSNAFSSIQLAYDLQAGSYTRASTTPEGAEFRNEFGQRLAAVLPRVPHRSVLDAGTGEGTSIIPFLNCFESVPTVYAFDASVSRIMWAQRNFSHAAMPAHLFVADTLEIPLPSDSVDLVVSIHSMEPNGGREQELLSELLRVARLHVVLVEPSPEFATTQQHARMLSHGYATEIWSAVQTSGAEVLLHEPWPLNTNPDNPAAVTILDAKSRSERMPPEARSNSSDALRYVSPRNQGPLIEIDAGYYSPSEGLVFPSVAGFPILLGEKAILATQLLDDFD